MADQQPRVRKRLGRYKSLVSKQVPGESLVTALFVRDFFGRSRHSGNLYSIVGLGRRFADMCVRECVRLARVEIWQAQSANNKAPPTRHAQTVELIGAIDVAADAFGPATETEDEAWRDWQRRYALETIRHGAFLKYRLSNILLSGAVTYVDFFVPEMLSFLKHVNIHLMNTRYPDKQLTIEGLCTYIPTDDFECQFE